MVRQPTNPSLTRRPLPPAREGSGPRRLPLRAAWAGVAPLAFAIHVPPAGRPGAYPQCYCASMHPVDPLAAVGPVVAAAGHDSVVAAERVEPVVTRVARECVGKPTPVELLDPRECIVPVPDRRPGGETCSDWPGRVEVRGCIPAGAAVDG